tara:strand:+ start:91 stop:639 length:549 start_codon:yes stop_codon:yes gene_type:complete
MNIFAIDNSPIKSGRQLFDKHNVKQILESFQMLGSAVIRHGATPEEMPLTSKGTPLKGGYRSHPSTLWAGENYSNFIWLCAHAIEMSREYTRRYSKVHACQKGIYHLLNMGQRFLPSGKQTPFSIAISEDMECRKIKGFGDLHPVTQYRLYYKIDKAHLANWKANKPHWYDYSVENIIQASI